MSGTLIGYARCSTDDQDLTAQRDHLRDLGVAERRIYLDHGLTGTNRHRPGLDQALAAVRGGDTLVVPKLDRLARSVPDARAIGDDLAAREPLTIWEIWTTVTDEHDSDASYAAIRDYIRTRRLAGQPGPPTGSDHDERPDPARRLRG
jgi:Resolvase, N terminal domain